MLALVLLFQMAPETRAMPSPPTGPTTDRGKDSRNNIASPFSHLTCPTASRIQAAIRDTAFDHHLVDRFPGLLGAEDVVADLQQQLLILPATHPAWSSTLGNLKALKLARLQKFWVYLKLGGHQGSESGPAWAEQRQGASAQASLGSQRAAGDSKRGLDHLLPPGLGKDAHIQRALAAENPLWHGAACRP